MPLVKLAYSADGDATHVPAGAGGLLVDLGSNNDVTVTSGAIAATQSGTWTVQPGNTANTTAWKVDGSAVTQPVSGTVTANAGTGTFTVSGTVTANAGTGTLGVQDNASLVDDAAFTPATSRVVMVGAEFDNTSPDSVDEGDAGALRMSANRSLYVNIRDNAGNERGLNVDASGNIGVTDAGGTLTVDGTVAATQSGTWNVTNVSGTVSLPTGAATSANQSTEITALQLLDDIVHSGDAALSKYAVIGAVLDDTGTGTVTENQAHALRMTSARGLHVQAQANSGVDIGDVTINNSTGASAVNIQDGGNSITVDGTVTASNTAGDIAHDSADSGNPVKIGMKAANALPTAVANNDRANAIGDLWGRQLTSHIDPAMAVHKAVNVTTTQTGSDVWSPTSGKRIAVTSIIVASYGTTSARVILWFGDNADTTYTAGTDQVLVAASFAPSATVKPGLVYTPAVPVFCTTVDRELHLTTDAAISLDITVEGYEY